MTPRQAPRSPVPSSADPERWRRDRLTAAGFPPELARQLAADRRVDLHAMLELVDRGCPPELAARILAPVEADLHRRDSRDRRH